LDTTTVLLLDVDPQSLHFEDDAVVFSPANPWWCHAMWRRPVSNKRLLLLLWSGLLHHFQGL